VPVPVPVPVPVVGDEVPVSLGVVPGEVVGPTGTSGSADADGDGLDVGAGVSLGEGVERGPCSGVGVDGTDGPAGSPRLVSVVPVCVELPNGCPSTSSETETTAIAATNSPPATSATGFQRSLAHHGAAGGARGS
jgi:hypothetical protein